VNGTDLVVVAQTDGIVSSMTADIVRYLKTLDYDDNNLGWGIDWTAIAFATCNGRLAVRDGSVLVRHPRGTGYDRREAKAAELRFISRLPPHLQVQCRLLMKACSASPVSLNRVRAAASRTGAAKDDQAEAARSMTDKSDGNSR
jgi:hypothetical protein